MMDILFKRTGAHSLPKPVRKSAEAAGFDFYSPEHVRVCPGRTELVPTKWCVQIPQGYVGILKERSSLARTGVIALGGVVDSDYRGEIKVLLNNLSEETIDIYGGVRFAQMLILRLGDVVDAREVDALDPTERGVGGLGSTGR